RAGRNMRSDLRFSIIPSLRGRARFDRFFARRAGSAADLRSKEISMTCSWLAIRLTTLGRTTALAALLAMGVAASAFAQASMPAPDGPPPAPAPKAATPAPA